MPRFRKSKRNTSSSRRYDQPDEYVTQPPRSPGGSLTGKISTLFRREQQVQSPPQQYPAEQQQQRKQQQRVVATSSPRSRLDRLANEAVGDNISVGSRGSRDSKRIYYSSNHDDSDDSYESRASASNTNKRDILSELDVNDDDDTDDDTETDGEDMTDEESVRQQQTRRALQSMSSSSTNNTKTDQDTVETDDHDDEDTLQTSGEDTLTTVHTIKRYRGFSTSISSLFLDESLVCGAMGCFGLILSYRTEYLLQLRNERRGALSPRSFRGNRRSIPSRVIAGALIITLLLIFSTFLIFGFGTGYGHQTTGVQLNSDGGSESGNDQLWDDYLSSNRNDDDGGNSYSDYNNNNNNGGANDDGGGNYNNYYNNNAAQNGNDDGQAQQQDMDNQGDDDQQNNGGNRRLRILGTASAIYPGGVQHPMVGVFKMRDYHEYFWLPLFATIQNELHHDSSSHKLPFDRMRRTEEVQEATDVDRITFFDRDLASDIRLILFITFILFLGILGRKRRMRTRFHLIRARAQEDHLYYASSDEAAARRVAFDDTREDQYEGACSHTLCGCYPTDEMSPNEKDEDVKVTDNGVFKRKQKPRNEDFVARTCNCLNASCCGCLFKCWFQCLSICALAQEAREVRLLIPPRYQRIDYITHQPFHEYQEAVNDLRRGWLGKARRLTGFMPHIAALSRLSRYVIGVFLITVTAIIVSLFLNPRAHFTFGDAVVLIATFVQAFVVLFIVHGIFHKSDLSLDAVIKMFAAGFLIATPTAFIFESIITSIGMNVSYIAYDLMQTIFESDFDEWSAAHWRILWIVGELFNAYIVASLTEELCKYYSFRAVEHPDLVFLTGLQREEHDEGPTEGGLVKYPFGSHQVQELVRSRSFSDDASRVSSQASHRTSRSRRSQTLLKQTGTTDTEFDEDRNDSRTRRQRAMAVTTGMISVAVGLACAENFIYVFVLGGTGADEDGEKGSVMEAWLILLFRSIFPLHALSAAMQSINMVRKFVEVDHHKGHRVGVGRIVLPAILLHGTFDAVLLAVNVFVETSWENYLRENNGNVNEEDGAPYNVVLVNLCAIFGIVLVMTIGIFWYYRENRAQKARLVLLEEQDKTKQAEEWVGVSSNESPMV